MSATGSLCAAGSRGGFQRLEASDRAAVLAGSEVVFVGPRDPLPPQTTLALWGLRRLHPTPGNNPRRR